MTDTIGSTLATRRRARLGARELLGCVAGGYALMAGLFAITPWQGTVDYLVAGALASVAVVTGTSWLLEGGRRARDRLAGSLISLCLLVMLLPLAFTVGYTAYRGITRFGGSFLSHDMTGVGPLSSNGGILHAIVGTLEQVGMATAMTVPVGLLVAIYVTEYGRGALAFGIRFVIDVMTGIPSIIAGLFVLAFWVLGLHRSFSGFAGSLALGIIELPIVVRATEEMIRLVPRDLREASYALGVPKWKTVLRIVLPTASTGIVTGVMLAVARVTGETAPILLVVGYTNFTNTNLFRGDQASLPTYIFQNAGSSAIFDVQRAWAAALTLILVVAILYIAARLLTRRNSLARR
jgi:phosphate transport system permease protein